MSRTFIVAICMPLCILAQEGTMPEGRIWGSRVGSYRLSISSDKAQYEIGEPVKIRSMLKNVTDHAVRLETTNRLTWYTKEVLLPATWLRWRQRAPLTGHGQELYNRRMNSVISSNIRPGGEVVDEVDLSGQYDMSRPGEYRITFSVREPVKNADDPDGGDYPRLWIISNSITLTVLPAK